MLIPREHRAAFAVLALILLAGVALSAAPDQPNQQANYAPQHEAVDGDSDWWDWRFSPEAIFTGVIAVFSIFSYFEFRKSGERQLRAYLWLDAKEVHDVGVGSKPWFMVKLHNSGQTPAYKVLVFSLADIRPYPLPLDTPWFEEDVTSHTRTVIYPRGAPLRHTLHLTLVIVGCIDYRFTWTPSEHHQTPFIYTIVAKEEGDPDGRQLMFMGAPDEKYRPEDLQLNEGAIEISGGRGRTD